MAITMNFSIECPVGAEDNTPVSHLCDLGSILSFNTWDGLRLPGQKVGFLQVLQYLPHSKTTEMDTSMPARKICHKFSQFVFQSL